MNHASEPNCVYNVSLQKPDRLSRWHAVRNITKGEELFRDYGEDFDWEADYTRAALKRNETRNTENNLASYNWQPGS